MKEFETVETSAMVVETAGMTPTADTADKPGGGMTEPRDVSEELMAESEALQGIYPGFDLTAELEHPAMGALLRGEKKPTLRQLYEAVHMEDIVAGRVEEAVEARIACAVETAVARAVEIAVRDCEEKLLGHIRARGQRPAENGTRSAQGIRMHPAVDRLTRRERAMLAKRAENGETITL